MKLEQMLNSNGTSDLATYDAQINALRADVNNYQSKYNNYLIASNNWAEPAWEDSKSKWRNGKLDKFIQKRIGEARNYYHLALSSIESKNASQALLDDAIAKKTAFENALQEGAAKGLDSSQVSSLYQSELANLQAQQDAINAQAAAAEKSAASSANLKYYIIGGVAVLLIAGFFIMKRKK